MKFESAERARPEKEERSQEEIDRINESKERLQALIDKAATTADMAVNNELMLELDGARLRKFLEEISKDANDVDNPENDTDIIVAYIESLCERVRLPGDIRMEENGKLLLQRFEELEQEKARQKITGNIDGGIGNYRKPKYSEPKKRRGFLRL